MLNKLFIAFLLASALPLSGQTASSPSPATPKEPQAVFAAAAPFYDFSNSALEPWYLKAAYQLYDDDGKPAEQGTYEYWWASPHVYRSTWTRPGATHSDWYTLDGKHSYKATGESLSFFEYKLQTALLSPLPDPTHLDPANFRLEREEKNLSGGSSIPCVMVIPQHAQTETVTLGMFPTYCFDSNLPALRISYEFGSVATEFNHLVRTQSRILPMEVLFFEGGRQILSAKVEAVNSISPDDPALTPASDASNMSLERAQLMTSAAADRLIKKVPPAYPRDAKDARISGTVILHAVIGVDGAIQYLDAESAPSPSLAAAVFQAVSRWQYKPYLVNGEPVEVETTIRVIYTLGG